MEKIIKAMVLLGIIFSCTSNTNSSKQRTEVRSKRTIVSQVELDSDSRLIYEKWNDHLMIKIVIGQDSLQLENEYIFDLTNNMLPKLKEYHSEQLVMTYASGQDMVHAMIVCRKNGNLKSFVVEDYVSCDLTRNLILFFEETDQIRGKLVCLNLKSDERKEFDYSKNNPIDRITGTFFEKDRIVIKYDSKTLTYAL